MAVYDNYSVITADIGPIAKGQTITITVTWSISRGDAYWRVPLRLDTRRS